jgi:hypothetical protein
MLVGVALIWRGLRPGAESEPDTMGRRRLSAVASATR